MIGCDDCSSLKVTFLLRTSWAQSHSSMLTSISLSAYYGQSTLWMVASLCITQPCSSRLRMASLFCDASGRVPESASVKREIRHIHSISYSRPAIGCSNALCSLVIVAECRPCHILHEPNETQAKNDKGPG